MRIDRYVFPDSAETILRRLRPTAKFGLRDILVKREDLVITCPFHAGGHERKPACSVYIGRDMPEGTFNCFACNTKGDFLKLVAGALGTGREKALQYLLDNFQHEDCGVDLNMGDDIAIEKPEISHRPVSLEGLEPYCDYLATRGISRETCELLGIRYDPIHRQVVFPCYRDGKPYFTARRSIDSKSFHMDDTDKPLYCLDLVKKMGIKKVLLVEGPVDCATGWEYGYPAIATFGQPSERQIDSLNKSGIRTVYLMFDNDAAGDRFKRFVKSRLSSDILVEEPVIPEGRKDINDLKESEVDEIIGACNTKIAV